MLISSFSQSDCRVCGSVPTPEPAVDSSEVLYADGMSGVSAVPGVVAGFCVCGLPASAAGFCVCGVPVPAEESVAGGLSGAVEDSETGGASEVPVSSVSGGSSVSERP